MAKTKAKQSAAQKRATAKMIAANKARKGKGTGKGARVKVKRASSGASGLGARVSVLEGKVGELRRDVDDHTSLFGYMKTHSKGLFAAPSKGRR